MAAGRSLLRRALGVSSSSRFSSVAPLCWRGLQAALSLCFVHRCALCFEGVDGVGAAIVMSDFSAYQCARVAVCGCVHSARFGAACSLSRGLAELQVCQIHLMARKGANNHDDWYAARFKSRARASHLEHLRRRPWLSLKSARRGTARTGQQASWTVNLNRSCCA